MQNPLVKKFLARIATIHDKKNNDYAAGDPYENFMRAAEVTSWFNNKEDKPFVNHIATKMARLATLLNSENEPNNESIDDSFLDLATYCILWGTYHQSKNK